MNDRILAKIEESRARDAREVAAAKSQREYAAGLRDEMNAAVRNFNRACAADPKAAAEYARHKASQASCHWCGLPLRNRHCTECGDQDLPL